MTTPVIILPALTVTTLYLLVATSCNAANLTTNIDGEACQGEEWILICTGRHSFTHRWILETKGSKSIQMTYIVGDPPGTTRKVPYNFTLLSATRNLFESSVSVVLTSELNNTVAKCSDTQSEADPVAIRIAESLSSPQALMSRVLESDSNYSTIEVTWEPPGNGSRVDFYYYQVVVDMEGTNDTVTLYDVKTTNTTIILTFPYKINNITFLLSATDNCRGESKPTALFLNYMGRIDPFDTTVTMLTNSNTIRPSTVTLYSTTNATNAYNSTVTTPIQKIKSKNLLISISTFSAAIILSLVLIIICLVMVLKHTVHSETLSATCTSDSVNVYAELEPTFPQDIDIDVAGESVTNESGDEHDVNISRAYA